VNEDVRLHVGCAMWSHPAWPRHRRQLATYATWCNAVEGNTTFYGVPSASTVTSWAEQAPADFRFVFKFPRPITHERRLRDTGRDVAEFLDAVAPLGERVWTVTAQLPASFGPPALGTLVAFLATLPTGFRYAVEVRHPRFFDGSPAARALGRALADHGVEWVGFDTTTLFASAPTSDGEREAWSNKPRLPRHIETITDRPIVRYIGRDDAAATAAGWAPWLPVVAGWLAEGRRPTVFVHTPDNADALALARAFHADVARLVPPLAPLPEPWREEPATLF
jgi:uncharacterized protein YecE (DUF72 family)